MIRTFVCTTVDCQSAPDLLGAFLHAEQAEMFRLAIPRNLIIKSESVVAHTQLYAPRIKFQINQNVARLRVPHRVVNGFLSDSQQVAFDQLAERPERAANFNFGLNRGLSG